MSLSKEYKDYGNIHFQARDYIGAEGLYSKAIVADPKNALLYTNRALSRIKLGMWDSAASDCNTCLSLSPNNMKAHYYLAQSHFELKNYDAALEQALLAHSACAATSDKSISSITALVLRCKKQCWEAADRARHREATDLERELMELLERQRDEALGQEDEALQRDSIGKECDLKQALLRDLFDRARNKTQMRREVPDWAIDEISFGFMVDPVVTRTGKSYERASIMEHLRRHPSDPLTREPLQPSDLRPNIALRQACDDFLKDNGWAVDW
ncbi:hypothetical protein CDD81_4623 [Ophiocordyceps australis]|uniref:U-box domain-containing protein n=1 Tax=Ophiocordyceps australis TaxID=1399860 RepID=A0A2C5YAW5_9HYPO|nr:hypothetical protein CDD81_4623 [Ophiocordyceps australis]